MTPQAQHLFNAADYHALPRLRAICERTLCESLTAENAAFTLTLAEQHSAAALKRESLLFVAHNVDEVMATEGWAHLDKAKPALKDEEVGKSERVRGSRQTTQAKQNTWEG